MYKFFKLNLKNINELKIFNNSIKNISQLSNIN